MPRNPAQDKRLSAREIRRLQRSGLDIHKFKRGGRKVDLFKDAAGNVYIKPISGVGAGDPTGFNLKSIK